MKTKHCLRCGHDMTTSPWHICPKCGKFFAFYTQGQAIGLIVGSVLVAIVVCGALVMLLWKFA